MKIKTEKIIDVEEWDALVEATYERPYNYPDVQMIANDLHAKGLLEAGDYCIEIDW